MLSTTLTNNWDQLYGCTAKANYACISGYPPSKVPNLATLANHYTILDHALPPERCPASPSLCQPAIIIGSTRSTMDRITPPAITGSGGSRARQ